MSSYGNQWFAAGASGGWSGIQAIARFDNSSTSELTRDQVTASNQDKWTSTHVGGNFTPDLYHPGMGISASVIAAHTGKMLIKRGTDASGSTSNTAWSSDGSSYGPVHYLAMEIQQ